LVSKRGPGKSYKRRKIKGKKVEIFRFEKIGCLFCLDYVFLTQKGPKALSISNKGNFIWFFVRKKAFPIFKVYFALFLFP